jgi:hypothetical protein
MKRAENKEKERWSKPILDKDKVLASIFRISGLLTTPSRVDEILERILDEVVGTIGFDRGIIRLFDETRQFLHAKVCEETTPRRSAAGSSHPLNIHETTAWPSSGDSGELLGHRRRVQPTTASRPWIRHLTKIMDEGSIFIAP